MRTRNIPALILIAAAIGFAPSLRADNRVIPPQISKTWPVGMQRGTSVTCTLSGRNLDRIEEIIFDTPGLTAKVIQVNDEPEPPKKGFSTDAPVQRGKLESATLQVTAAPDAAPGLHWYRIRTPLGTSNMMPFDVGFLPEVHAAGRGDMQPEPVKLPATLVGTIAIPGQVDTYPFDGQAGEEVVFQVRASQLGSRLESLLVLRNEAGEKLAESGQYYNRADAVLTYKLPQAGKYTLSVSDREEGGSMGHYYRIDAGPLPYITGVFPLGVQAGEKAKVNVTGVNLGDSDQVTVDPPKSAEGWTTTPLRIKSAQGWSLNAVDLAVGSDPEVMEQEPNNTPAQAQRISLPATINGHIWSGEKNGGAPDEDYFRFHAAKGEHLSIEVAAARLGSPLDSVIEVLDAQGNPIPRATLRCLNETVSTLSDRDSRGSGIRMTSTSGFHEGDDIMVGDELDKLVYIADQPDEDVRMRTADGLRWAELGTTPDAHAVNTPIYRVQILPPGAEFPPNGLPVFHLYWRNDDGGPGYGADSQLDFTAPADADYILHVKDVRGLEGPDFAYRVTLHDAVPDYAIRADDENPNIPKGGSAMITVNANRVEGYQGPIDIRVEGLPKGITASPATIPAGQDLTMILLTADSGDSSDSAPSRFRIVGHAQIDGKDRVHVVEADAPLEVASVVPAADVVVTTDLSRVTLQPGQDVKVTLHVDRRNGFEGRVPCTVRNLPPGVRVVNVGLNGVLVTESQSSRTFTLHAEEWAKPITQPMYVVGAVESNSTTMHPSAPLMVEVVGAKETASLGPEK
jgi:hypothetical protein